MSGFVDEHRRDPFDAICYLPVFNLTVQEETEVLGLRLLNPSDPRIPQSPSPHALDELEPGAGSVAAVDARGTSYSRMAERSKETASHKLRLLRVALWERISVEQLRFRLGRAHTFEGEKAFGWRRSEEAAYDLGLNEELVELAADQPFSKLQLEPANNVEEKADLALRWMERAWFAGEPLVALLYLFFALEALLGDKSEELKGQQLAFRQALLDHAVSGTFLHPNSTLFLYEEIRSAAVHGEQVPEVSSSGLDPCRCSTHGSTTPAVGERRAPLQEKRTRNNLHNLFIIVRWQARSAGAISRLAQPARPSRTVW